MWLYHFDYIQVDSAFLVLSGSRINFRQSFWNTYAFKHPDNQALFFSDISEVVSQQSEHQS